MDKVNYYQVIEGSEMYYPWYVHKLENDIKVSRQLLEWAEECGFEFGQIFEENVIDEDEFLDKTQGMNYIETMLYYTERWMDKNEPG